MTLHFGPLRNIQEFERRLLDVIAANACCYPYIRNQVFIDNEHILYKRLVRFLVALYRLNRLILFVCLFVLLVFRPTFSLIRRRHHYLQRAANLDLYSALIIIEQCCEIAIINNIVNIFCIISIDISFITCVI